MMHGCYEAHGLVNKQKKIIKVQRRRIPGGGRWLKFAIMPLCNR